MRGHLRRRGDAWELRAYAGRDPTTGRQKYATRTFRGGKRQAEAALAHLVDEVSGDGHAATDTTVATLISRWFELARSELSPTTTRGYERIIDRYLAPALGNVPLARLKTAQIDRFYQELREHGGNNGGRLAPATVRQTHAVLRRALQQGVRWGWLTTNPAALATPPRVRPPRLSPPDPDGVMRLIETATATDPDFGCFIHVAATTGARRGELCALRWREVDLDTGTVLISRALVEAAHGALVEKDTKTHSARRIALDPATIVTLRLHRSRMEQRAATCGGAVDSNAYVFSRDLNGRKPYQPGDVSKAFIRLRVTVGLDAVRLHDLRHFAATRLLAAGVPVRTVSGRLGHANAATTLGVYAHFLEASDRDAAEKLGALLVAAVESS